MSHDGSLDDLAFVRLLSTLAEGLANARPTRWEETFAAGLGHLSEALGIDHCTLWRPQGPGRELCPALRWTAPGCEAALPTGPLRDSLPSLFAGFQSNGALWLDSLDHMVDPRDRSSLLRSGVRSLAVLPLEAGGRRIGAITFATTRAERTWDPTVRVRLGSASAVVALALAPLERSVRPLPRPAEPDRAGRRHIDHTLDWHREPAGRTGRPQIASESAAARSVLAEAESVAPTLATVLLLGETGTGKEVFAQAIHDRSPRRDRPLVRVNCAAIPAALIESELFGRERGAYTGALSRQVGRFELADGGTLFLDEIGELPLESQVKLLRAIQDRVVERLGGTGPIQVDVRLIAATNRNLEAAVAAREFREDLYYRLNVFPIVVPPLRDRLEDIPVLVWSFIEEFARASGKRIDSVAPESLAALQRHTWPGNVRELRNLVERAIILANGPRLVIEPPHAPLATHEARGTLAEVQIGHIRSVLEHVRWRVRGAGGAAELLGMKPTTLDSRMAKLGIRRPV